jgi:hypothetical protein
LAESDGRLADGRDYYELLANVNLGAGASMPVEVPLVLENAMSRIAAMALEKLADRSVKAFDPPEQAAFSFSHDLFRVPAGNHPPVAKAGSDWTTGLGQAVALDGTGSSDRDGQPLAYRWTLVKAPSGSRAVLTDPTSAGTGLVPDVAGTYEASLVVNDGYLDSLPDTVSIVAAPGGATGQNRSPAINSTAATGATGTRAYAYQVLATDPDGDLLTYSLTKSPMGMKIDANTGKIDWTPPQPHHDGMLYPVEVTVSDGKGGETTQSFSISVKICTCA